MLVCVNFCQSASIIDEWGRSCDTASRSFNVEEYKKSWKDIFFCAFRAKIFVLPLVCRCVWRLCQRWYHDWITLKIYKNENFVYSQRNLIPEETVVHVNRDINTVAPSSYIYITQRRTNDNSRRIAFSFSNLTIPISCELFSSAIILCFMWALMMVNNWMIERTVGPFTPTPFQIVTTI